MSSIKPNPIAVAVISGVAVVALFYIFGIPGMSKTQRTVSMKELLSAGIEAAKLGGNKVKEIREQRSLHEQVKGETAEGAKELKTDGDMASHKIMFHGLKNAFPEIMVRHLLFIKRAIMVILYLSSINSFG